MTNISFNQDKYYIDPTIPAQTVVQVRGKIKSDLKALNEALKSPDLTPSERAALQGEIELCQQSKKVVTPLFVKMRDSVLSEVFSSFDSPKDISHLVAYAHTHGKKWKSVARKKERPMIFPCKESPLKTLFMITPQGEKFLTILKRNNQVNEGSKRVVYRGVNLSKAEKVAAKLLKHNGAEQHIASTEHEYEILTSLIDMKCPNIPRPFGLAYITKKTLTGRVTNNVVVFFPFFDSSLGELIEKKAFYTTGISYAHVLKLFAPMAFLHANGLLHRDYKPANIGVLGEQFFCDDLETACKVTPTNVKELIKKYSGAGTPLYDSPETAALNVKYSRTGMRDEETINKYLREFGDLFTEKSDAWSFGISLFEFIFQHYPLDEEQQAALHQKGNEAFAMASAIAALPENWINGRIDKLEERSGVRVQPELREILCGLLQINPEERLSIIQALGKFLKIPAVASIAGPDFQLSDLQKLEAALSQQWILPPTHADT